MRGDKQLLPTAVTPSHYDLHLTPNLETFAYDGEMTVKLTVHEPTDAVTFHARDLEDRLRRRLIGGRGAHQPRRSRRSVRG